MTEVPDTIDDAIVALPSAPSIAQVLAAMSSFSRREVAATALSRSIVAQTVTQSVAVATDPDTFTGGHSFAVGHPCVVYVKVTLIDVVADGETFGVDDGDLSPAVTFLMSGDGLDVAVTGAALVIRDNTLLAVDDYRDYVLLAPGFVTVTVEIDQQLALDLYAGANHPTVTARIELTYV